MLGRVCAALGCGRRGRRLHLHAGGEQHRPPRRTPLAISALAPSTRATRRGTRRCCLLPAHHHLAAPLYCRPFTGSTASLLAARTLRLAAAAPLTARAGAAAGLLAPAPRARLPNTRRCLRICAPVQRPRAAVAKQRREEGQGAEAESQRPMRVLCVAEKRESGRLTMLRHR
jgi:hypothetical protein